MRFLAVLTHGFASFAFRGWLKRNTIDAHALAFKGGDSSVSALFVAPAEENEEAPDLSLEAFQRAKAKVEKQKQEEELESFDGYDFRDVLVEKWGECYDVDFNRVDSFGFRKLYLNILPYRLGKRPWRHRTEYDYLCHLQAVTEILQKYQQLDNILYQIQETNKKPLAGRSPIVAVPLRLDLTEAQVNEILGY